MWVYFSLYTLQGGGRGSDSPLDHETGDHVTAGHVMNDSGQSRPPPDNRSATDTEHLCRRP